MGGCVKRGSGDLESASSAGVRLTLERSDGTSGTAVVPVLRLEGEPFEGFRLLR